MFNKRIFRKEMNQIQLFIITRPLHLEWQTKILIFLNSTHMRMFWDMTIARITFVISRNLFQFFTPVRCLCLLCDQWYLWIMCVRFSTQIEMLSKRNQNVNTHIADLKFFLHTKVIATQSWLCDYGLDCKFQF